MRWIACSIVVALVGACGSRTVTPEPTPRPSVIAATVTAPGAIARMHAGITCERCHVGDSGQVADRECLECHSALRDRIWKQRGLHGAPTVNAQACKTCHADHRGAGFDMTRAAWLEVGGKDGFQHELTGFPVDGAHRGVACARCHSQKQTPATPTTTQPRERYDLAPRECAACHSGPHAATPFDGRACETCHVARGFSEIVFDHAAHTKFDIGLSHRALACRACHTVQRGASLPSQGCESCHAARDPHLGRFAKFGRPPRCAACHAPSKPYDPASKTKPAWKPNRFDHARDTKWPLTVEHRDLQCRACHRGGSPSEFEQLGAGAKCMGCHEHARVHDKKYKNEQCLNCHLQPGAIRTQPVP